MRKTDWKSGLMWVACFVLTVLVMGWVTREESDHGLEQDAEQFALRWARQLGRSVPDLALTFSGAQATPSTLAQIGRLHGETAAVRVRLFGTDGRLILDSTSADSAVGPKPPDAPASASTDPVRWVGVPAMRKQVLSGLASTRLHRGGGQGLPDVYSEVWVPITHEGQTLGLAQILVDQSARAASAAVGLVRIAMVVALLLVLIACLAIYQHLGNRKRQRQAEAQVRYLAEHDLLTGVLNRASFEATLARACVLAQRQPSRGFALLRVDLDRFRQTNDALGREAGDEVLRQTAQRLRALVTPDDRLGRLEGNEFAILRRGAGSADAAAPFARKVQQALAQPMLVAGKEIRCGASSGIALSGVDGSEPEQLLALSDLALFRAKTDDRGGFAFHDASLDQQMQSRRALARDLHAAVEASQLTAYYQPLFAQDGKELVGYEALLRWEHPERGMVSPAEFVPLAEAAGLIDEIGLWMLRQACHDASQWPGALTVAVNLSANQFASGQLVRQVSRALGDSGLAPERLGLEITESLLMNNSDHVMQTLRNLGALGVSIAMDDFGTGYSSLAYLWRFPFDKVKVDQVFTRNMVKDPKVAMIVRSIITLAHSLDMRVNAEGIESSEQMAALQALGCDELQGFMLGRPGPQASLTHAGHRKDRTLSRPRGEDRESLFATLHMGLPSGLDQD